MRLQDMIHLDIRRDFMYR